LLQRTLDRTRRILFLAIAISASSWAGAQPAHPTLDVPWKNDPQDVVVYTENVRNFGAKADGRTDDSAAFAAALAAAVKTGGGIVYAPAGRYLFEHNIDIPNGITLRGDWTSPQEGGLGKGTILEVVVGRGEADGAPFMDMGVSSGLRDVTFYYPGQNASAITAYPYTVRTQFSAFLRHITFVNSYRAISHGYGNGSGGNLIAEHIYGTPLDVGLFVNVGFDYSSIASIRFSPAYWPAFDASIGKSNPSLASTVARWTYDHASGIVTGYADTIHWCGIDVDGYRRGMCCGPAQTGVWMGGRLDKSTFDRTDIYGQFYDMRLTGCAEALRLDSIQGTGAIFSNCRFDGDLAVGISTNSALVFDQCRFHGKAASIKCVAPYPLVNVLSSKFFGDGPVNFQAGVVALTNNRFDATLPRNLIIGKECKATVRTQPLDMPLWPAAPGGTTPLRSPRSRRVIDASAAPYNAPADGHTDAAPVLQKALDDLRANGGTVFLHAGEYLLGEPIVVPPRVEIRGVGDVMSRPVGKGIINSAPGAPIAKDNITGTALFVSNGQGGEVGPTAITLGADSGIRGVTIFYPVRRAELASIPFPPAIAGNGDRCYVTGVDLVDPYVGIEMHNASHYLIKDIYTGSDHLGVRILGGSGGVIENVAAHAQFLVCNIPRSWHMVDHGAAMQLDKSCTAIQIDGATDQLVQACGQFMVQNGFVVRGGPDGQPSSVTFRLVSCDSVAIDGMRLESNSRVTSIGYQSLASGPDCRAITTTATYTASALYSGNLFRQAWLECAGAGRVEIVGAVLESAARSKVNAAAGQVLVHASIADQGAGRRAPIESAAAMTAN